MKIKPREKKLIIATVSLAAAFGLYRLAVQPLLDRQGELSSRLAELESNLSADRESIRRKDAIEAQFRTIAVDLSQHGSNEQEIARLLQDLRRHYNPMNLTDKGTKVLPVEEAGFYRKFRVAMELEGQMLALADFLHTISTAKEPLKIEQLNIRASGGAGGAEAVRGSIVISAVYTLPGDAKKTGGEE